MNKSILRQLITFFVVIVIFSVVPFSCTCGEKPPSDNAADNNNPSGTGGGNSGGSDNTAGGNNVAGGGTGTGGGNVAGDGTGTGTGGGNVVGGGDGTGTGTGGGNVVGGGNGGGDDDVVTATPRSGYVGSLIVDASGADYVTAGKMDQWGRDRELDSVWISADGLRIGLRTGLLSDADDNNRGFDDLGHPANTRGLFSLRFPGDKPALFFINRSENFSEDQQTNGTDVTTNDLALTAVNTCVNSSESADEAVATQDGGGTCRYYDNTGSTLTNYNYLGTVFRIPDNQAAARGTMRCGSFLRSRGTDGNLSIINDTTIFNEPTKVDCFLGVVNSTFRGFNATTIQDSWVRNSISSSDLSSRTVRLYAIGINIEGKTISQWSSENGFNKAMFDGELDNAAMKKILEENEWADIVLNVGLVSSTRFEEIINR